MRALWLTMPDEATPFRLRSDRSSDRRSPELANSSQAPYGGKFLNAGQ